MVGCLRDPRCVSLNAHSLPAGIPWPLGVASGLFCCAQKAATRTRLAVGMRPEFAVILGSADMRAMEALAASLKAAGFPAGAQGPSSDQIWVMVPADDAEAACERVMQNLPADGDYVIERVDRVRD